MCRSLPGVHNKPHQFTSPLTPSPPAHHSHPFKHKLSTSLSFLQYFLLPSLSLSVCRLVYITNPINLLPFDPFTPIPPSPPLQRQACNTPLPFSNILFPFFPCVVEGFYSKPRHFTTSLLTLFHTHPIISTPSNKSFQHPLPLINILSPFPLPLAAYLSV